VQLQSKACNQDDRRIGRVPNLVVAQANSVTDVNDYLSRADTFWTSPDVGRAVMKIFAFLKTN